MTHSDQVTKVVAIPASPWKRLIAWVYDWLPLTGVFVLFFVIGLGGLNLIALPFDLDPSLLSERVRNNPIWIIYLTLSSSSYYIWCWQKGGQTIGLKTWRMKLVNQDGHLLSTRQSIVRALLSLGGIANFWAFFNQDNRGWHDIAVNAYLVELPNTKR